MGFAKDITGVKKGKLTGLSKLPSLDKHNHAMWICRCDCGNEVTVRGADYLNGAYYSCPECRKEDLTGKTFGLLTVIEHDKKKSDSSREGGKHKKNWWFCQCECGNTVSIVASALREGKSKSCGCQIAKTETFIANHGLVDDTILCALSSKPTKSNTTGVRGVSFVSGRYSVSIQFKSKTYYLGRYKTLEEAAEARRQAEKDLWIPVLEKNAWDCGKVSQ